MLEPSLEQVLIDVKYHSIAVLRNEGVRRHLRFQKPGTSAMLFDIITWPGCLCYTGDMGTYAFSRVHDMFPFFRSEHNSISPGYWSEKLIAVDKHGGYQVFDAATFESRVTEHFDAWVEDNPRLKHLAPDLWKEIEEHFCFSDTNECVAYAAIDSFKSDVVPSFWFQDFFDGGGTERYTHRYIWACRAIVWGINQFDLTTTKNDRNK